MNTTLETIEPGLSQASSRTTSHVQPRNGFDCVRGFVYAPKALEVANSLVKTGAYRVNVKLPRDKWYTWRSGIKAPCYCDCRALCGHALDRRLVAATLVESVRDTFPKADLIVGMATGGIPWADAVANELDLPLAYVRSTAKPHGIGGLVECSPPKSTAAIIIDDLVASGESIKQAAHALAQEANITTIGVQSIVNWGFLKMHRTLSEVTFRALTSYPQILTLALNHSLIDEQEFVDLIGFYQNPSSHQWRSPAY
jgi:orotate phosphoribosyltransferase